MRREKRIKLLLAITGILVVLVFQISLPVFEQLKRETNSSGSAFASAAHAEQAPIDTEAALNASSEAWGLGTDVSKYVSNSVDYNWYIDQKDTGAYSSDNCGPAALVMAATWRDAAFEYTVEDMREDFRSEGGWWYPDDLSDALDMYDQAYQTEKLESVSALQEHLDAGQILIVNNNMRLVTYNPNEAAHVGRFYENVEGHFIIVKGYAVVDDVLYFEVYDPASMHDTYDNGLPKGLNRYYEASNLLESILAWYDTVWIINPAKSYH